MKTIIIGGGNMGSTFARSFLSAHIIRPDDLTIVERNVEALQRLRELNIHLKTTSGDFVKDSQLIVLAVKPQDSASLYPRLKPHIREDHHIVLSIMAGVKVDTIEKELGIKRIIRAMPNLPAQIGMGMTGFTANEEVTRNELIQVQNLLSTTGKAIYFEEERMLDAVTAVSGSGPAYVYYYMDAMIKAACEIGFNESQAELLVWQTFLGAIHLQNKNAISCEEWIKRVASRGGTTEAALKVFNETAIGDSIQKGLKAAFNRAVELGEETSK